MNPVRRPQPGNGHRRNWSQQVCHNPRGKTRVPRFLHRHPDPEHGEQLTADTLGVPDRDAKKPDAINLSFKISMVKNIKPKYSIGAKPRANT